VNSLGSREIAGLPNVHRVDVHLHLVAPVRTQVSSNNNSSSDSDGPEEWQSRKQQTPHACWRQHTAAGGWACTLIRLNVNNIV